MEPKHIVINHKLIEQHQDIADFTIIHRQSTSIEFVGFNPDSNQLFVQFINGNSYIYEGVDLVIMDGARNCPSIGKYVNDFIKPSYLSTKYGYKLVTVLKEGVREV